MMDLGITVRDLRKFCEKQILKGNGDKYILISDDDEGNGFHTLFHGFTDSDVDGFEYLLDLEHDRTHTKDNCVILG